MYDLEQAQLRLANTIVEFDGRPVYVIGARNGVDGTIYLRAFDLPNQREEMKIDLNDERLNFRDFKLGYINYNGMALYMTRKPARQQQQGLSGRNVVVGDGRWHFDNIYADPCINDFWRGIYPRLPEARAILDAGGAKSVAFSRRFAICKDPELGFYELHYKGNRTAWGDPNQFNLPSNYTYLTELMQEEGIMIR